MRQIEYLYIIDGWLTPIIEKARTKRWRATDGFTSLIACEGEIMPVTDDVFVLKGSCPEHTDSSLPPYSSILVLRARKAILRAQDKESLRVRPGMLLSLNIHHRHQLVQNPNSVFVFAAIDSKFPVRLADMIEKFRSLDWRRLATLNQQFSLTPKP